MPLKLSHRGDLKVTQTFLLNAKGLNRRLEAIFRRYGDLGVGVLSSATPVDTGETRNAWSYSYKRTPTGCELSWINSNTDGGVPVVILLQYGHATRNGSFVAGRDFINPAIRPVLDALITNLWKEVQAL